jgi:hypothetical protein
MSDKLSSLFDTDWPLKSLIAVVALYLGSAFFVGLYWNSEPEAFNVAEIAAQSATENNEQQVVGYTSTSTLIHLGEVLLHKPGGYLSNDVTPPGVWLDNVPNWEFGVLVQIRDFSRAMRRDFARSQSQSTEDADIALAEPLFNFDNNSWAVPDTEGEYTRALMLMGKYRQRLTLNTEPRAQFNARADNLANWLQDVQSRLGSLSQRLSASVGKKRINLDLNSILQSPEAVSADGEFESKTPWTEIDDVFYESRGSAYALIHLLKAIEVDFSDVLRSKNALLSLRQIIRELEATQQTVWSPVILNGSGFGLFANHSLVMASYIARANAATMDLRELLIKG